VRGQGVGAVIATGSRSEIGRIGLAVSFVSGLFGFGPLHLHDLAMVMAVGLIALAVLEGAKRPWPR
jgi:hypothetical protein